MNTSNEVIQRSTRTSTSSHLDIFYKTKHHKMYVWMHHMYVLVFQRLGRAGIRRFRPRQGLFSCRSLSRRGQICYIPSSLQSLNGSCHHIKQIRNQPVWFANPACGQLNRRNDYFPRPRSRLRMWSRETGSVVPSRVRRSSHLSICCAN